MKLIFDKDYLQELYTEGKSKNKKHKFPKGVVEKYIDVVNTLKSVNKIEDLYRYNSLRYEKKKGDLKGIEAVRINIQYRLEFISTIENDEITTITVCTLLDISNHYKK